MSILLQTQQQFKVCISQKNFTEFTQRATKANDKYKGHRSIRSMGSVEGRMQKKDAIAFFSSFFFFCNLDHEFAIEEGNGAFQCLGKKFNLVRSVIPP